MDDLIRRSPVISIHAPPRGATTPTSTKPTSPPHFNSRPSARGDRQPNHADRRHQISIHAPPRGATPACGVRLEGWAISIHAPPRGATALPGNRRMPTCNFNSRPSARGDGKRYAISANLLFNPYKSAWLNNSATQFVEIILVIFHRIIA